MDSNAPADFHTVFTNAKAGMEGLSEQDKERIKKTIFDMSKDSAHFKNEQRKQALVEEKIAALKQKAARVTADELTMHQRSMDQKVATLIAAADLSRTWIHVDMDAFFASVEELDNPALKHVPMAVGGIGMISTANYPARKFGVRSAMPGFIAKVLCPQLVFVPVNFDKYCAVSQKTRLVFSSFDPDHEAGSLDEAHLDVTDYCSRTGLTGAEVAEQLRARIREETQLTCSCGVASNKMLAKICSDLHKPDGQYVLGSRREDISTFINTLPVRKVPGVGRVTEQVLAAFGVQCCGDVIPHMALLSAVMSPALMDFVLRAALGFGQTRHSQLPAASEPHRKGISCERTFKALSSKTDLEAVATTLVHQLCSDMAAEGIEGQCVTLKIKAAATFQVRTRATTLTRHISSPSELLPAVIKLLHAELPFTARLLGIRMSALRKKGARAGGGGTSPLSRYFPRQQPQQQEQEHAGGRDERCPAGGGQQQGLGQQTSPAHTPSREPDHGMWGEQAQPGSHGREWTPDRMRGGGACRVPGAAEGMEGLASPLHDMEGSLHGMEEWLHGMEEAPGASHGMGQAPSPGLAPASTGCPQSRCSWSLQQPAEPGMPYAASPGVSFEGLVQQGWCRRQGDGGCPSSAPWPNGRVSEPSSGAGDFLGQPAHQQPAHHQPAHHQPAHQEPALQQPGAAGKLWTCLACTYTGNRPEILRCSICDTLKGCAYSSSGTGGGGSTGGTGGAPSGTGRARAKGGGVGKRTKAARQEQKPSIDRFLSRV